MRTRLQQNISVLRFKRWARVKYAAFCSLGRQISIGCLRADMCDCSLQKQDFSFEVEQKNQVFDADLDNCGEAELFVSDFTLVQLLPLQQDLFAAAACVAAKMKFIRYTAIELKA